MHNFELIVINLVVLCKLVTWFIFNIPNAGCQVPIFFLFFWPVPIFSYFYKKTSYFYYFLTVGAMQLVHLASIFSLFCCLFVLILFIFILVHYLQHT